jgi:hypothetical protein
MRAVSSCATVRYIPAIAYQGDIVDKAETRRRLADLMDERRGELRLRWRDVADAGGISYEVVRAVRNGTGDIRLLTQRGIEDGLKWEQGSVRAILAGGDPRPLPQPETPRGGYTAEEQALADAYIEGLRQARAAADRDAGVSV